MDRTLQIQKWSVVENFSPFVCGRALLQPLPPVPDVNLRLILAKIYVPDLNKNQHSLCLV